MKYYFKLVFGIVFFCFLAVCAAGAGEFPKQQMTGKEMKALLALGKELKLGGPGYRYQGWLILNPDGTGKGQAVTDSGKKINIEGTWGISNDEFCRTWKDLNDGKKICEKWFFIKKNMVEVRVEGKVIGVNSW
jgi:hypothetical protein